MKQALSHLVLYLLWGVNAVLGMLGLLLFRSTLLKAYVALRLGRWQYAAVDKWSLLFLATGCLAFIVWCETYYRKGMSEGDFWSRFASVTVIEGGLVGAIYVARLLM